MSVTWLGSDTCNICNRKCKSELFDFRTVAGFWATGCRKCYDDYGTGKLGIGRGQRYEDQNGVWVQVEGGYNQSASEVI